MNRRRWMQLALGTAVAALPWSLPLLAHGAPPPLPPPPPPLPLPPPLPSPHSLIVEFAMLKAVTAVSTDWPDIDFTEFEVPEAAMALASAYNGHIGLDYCDIRMLFEPLPEIRYSHCQIHFDRENLRRSVCQAFEASAMNRILTDADSLLVCFTAPRTCTGAMIRAVMSEVAALIHPDCGIATGLSYLDESAEFSVDVFCGGYA